MSFDKPTVKSQVVDGREFFVPDIADWPYFLAGGQFQGKSVYSEGLADLLAQHAELARRHEELFLSFRAFTAESEHFTVCMLLRTARGLQPVHIECLECEECGWSGNTANPMVADLYIGFADPFAAMRSAEAYPVLSCPKCGSKLPRHPIWIEPLSQ